MATTWVVYIFSERAVRGQAVSLKQALISRGANDSGSDTYKENVCGIWASLCSDGNRNSLLSESPFSYPHDTILPCLLLRANFLLSAMNRFEKYSVVSWNILFSLTQWICCIIFQLNLHLLTIPNQFIYFPQCGEASCLVPTLLIGSFLIITLTPVLCTSFLVMSTMILNNSFNIPVYF